MQILILEASAAPKALLRAQVTEGLRQADIRGIDVTDAPMASLAEQAWGLICGVLIGPSAFAALDETVERVRSHFQQGPLGIVLDADAYAQHGVALTRKLGARVFSIAELTAIASFLVECEQQLALRANRKNKNIFGICQFKGGVGTTSITTSLGACWARHGIKTVLVDLDDVDPHITSWARVALARRAAVAEHLSLGHIPESRINDIASPVESFNGNLAVIGQPDNYNEGFHFKANVMDMAPSSSEFMHSLLSALKASYEVVLLDLARSWGLATFAALPRCQRVLLVVDEDKHSIRRSLDCLLRFKKESDDPDEFDFSRWSIVVNGYTGTVLPEKSVRALIQESDLFNTTVPMHFVPYTLHGREWGEPGVTLYDRADRDAKRAFDKIAYELVPFRIEQERERNTSGIAAWLGRLSPKKT